MVKSKFYNLDTDETLSSNSDYYVPSEKAIKTYVDTNIPTVNDGQLDIQINGSSVGTFTANQSENTIANITISDSLPDQTGNAGKFLETDGSNASWINGCKYVGAYDNQTKYNIGDIILPAGYFPYNAYAAYIRTADAAAGTSPWLYSLAFNVNHNINVSWEYDETTSVDMPIVATKRVQTTGRLYAGGTSITAATAPTINNLNGLMKVPGGIAGYSPDSAFGTVAFSNDYDDLSNKPTIPTVNNATITINQDGVQKGTFTLNQSSDATINLDAGGGGAVDSVNGYTGVVVLTASDVNALPNTTTINDLTTSTQQAALNSGANSTNIAQITTNTNDISTINGKIPSVATTTNQLADKDFVNSSISTNTANFIGTFNSVAELEAYSGTVTNNDYAFVINRVVTDNGNDWANLTSLNAYDKTLLTNFDYAWVVNGSNFDLYRFDIVNQTWVSRITNTPKTDITLNTAYNRYKATVSGSTITWAFEYTLNNSSFTAVQWAAINSGANTSNVTQITTNQNAIGTLSNLSTSTKTDLVSAINEVNGVASTAIQPNDNVSSLTNDAGYLTSSDLPSNHVTTDTDQNITGTKTFVGTKKIAFKQSGNSDKLGFTLYTSNNTEKGYLEFNPTNTIDGAPLMALGNYASSAASLTQVGFRRYSSISGASGAYNLLTPMIADAKTPFNLTTTYTNFYLPLGWKNGSSSIVTATKDGVVDLSTLIPSKTSDLTNDSGFATETWVGNQGYLTGINSSDVTMALGYTPVNPTSLATVATSGSYNDLLNKPTIPAAQVNADWNASSGVAQILNKPTIPTVNNATLTIQKNGTTIKTFTANASSNVTANITVPTNTNELTNGAGFITGIDSSDVTTALGYTPADDSNVVKTSGSQTVGGVKTFTSGINIGDTTEYRAQLYKTSSNSGNLALAINKQDNSGWLSSISLNKDGTINITPSTSVTAPTPATSDNSTKIATTAFVKNQGYATNSTLSSSPYLVLYGTSTSAADATAKIVEISSSYATTPTISAGQLLIVKPTITSTVADSTITVQKSSTTLLAAKTMKYNNTNITTSTDSIVWSANVPSIFVYDGTYWVFLGHGLDNNTTYSAMSVSEGTTGTATSSRVMRADYLKQIIEELAISKANTYYDSTSSTLYIG